MLVTIWLAPTTTRIELIVAYLLHEWLKAEGSDGLLQVDAELEDATLSSSELIKRISELKNEARKQLLMEVGLSWTLCAS